MEAKFTKTTCFIFALVSSLVIINVTGRPLRDNSSDELVSDGIDDQHKKLSTYLVLNGVVDYSKKCEHMYGFLPCAESLWGHLFLILVYEYLLFHGESYVASGGERIFKILGPGVFGASAFEILGALPESFILLASGLLNNTEKAQEYALTGVGLLAGTTIFLLTIVWGTCIIIGSTQDPSVVSNVSSQSQVQTLISKFNGYRVTTDAETSYMARIMVLSVVPFLIILIPKFFQISLWGEHFFIIVALIVSVLFLASYFVYQVFEPWIQKRRLDYVKHEHLVIDILKQLQERTVEKILTEDGAPNVPVIRSLFQKIDHDGDNLISFSELRELLYEVRFRNSNWDKDKKLAEVMDEFDIDGDRKITMDEFVAVFTKWLDETKRAMDKQYRSVKSLKDIYKILQPWIQNKRKEHEIKKQLVAEIIRHVQRSALGSLFTEDGTPDISAVKRLFVSIDHDNDNCISQEELKELIVKINIGKVPWEVDEIVKNIMEDLDVNGDHVINEEEFTSGLLKWLDENQARDSTEADDDTYQRKWDEIETLALEERSIEKSIWSMTKAIMLLVIGIVMLALLAEPLIESVHNFSKSAEIPSFFISFMLVPLATNARGAISAIKAASRKKEKTTSLTLSEIYGAVFINNLLGFSVLLYLIYFWGLSWKFSAEVLIVLIVSLVTGFTASFNSTFQIWKSFVAYLLYPLSLLLVYLLHR